MFDVTFLDNPGIAWLLKLFITLILCALIVARIKVAGTNWAETKSLLGVVNELVETLIMILAIAIIFSFKLSQIIGVLLTVWWFIYDTVIAPILRWLGIPV